jgi:hypothetical protein
MMARDLVACTAARPGRPFDNVHARAVVADHVEIGRYKRARPAVVDVPAHRERLQEYLGHEDSGSEVEYDTAFDVLEVSGEAAEIGHAGGADGGSIRGWVLVDDLGANRGVRGECDAEPAAREEE